MAQFRGSVQELKDRLASAGIDGTWAEEEGKHSFRSREGGILNWWPGTATVQTQGKQEGRAALEALFGGSAGTAPPQVPVPAMKVSRQIFIVHGHDAAARDQLELALHRLDLDPYVLMNESGGGKTIIEALEGKIGRDFSSDFGIVLMTPDDLGYAKKDGTEKAEPRARQNVILETGMLLSSLTRERIAIVVKGHVELPSDLQGIIQFRYNDHIREIVPQLCQRLKEAAFDLQPGQIAAAAQ